jgi:hypothetical protein
MQNLYVCTYNDTTVELKTSVSAADLREAASRFFTTVGIRLGFASGVPTELLQEIPTGSQHDYAVARDGWSLQITLSPSDQGEESRTFSAPELNTILAALRFYREAGMADAANRSEHIQDIATGGGEEICLDDAAIDELCERINFTAEPSSLPGPVVIIRNTDGGEILVQANHAVKVIYLEDDKTGEDGPGLVVLNDIEMWQQQFDVLPSDLRDIISRLNVAEDAVE